MSASQLYILGNPSETMTVRRITRRVVLPRKQPGSDGAGRLPHAGMRHADRLPNTTASTGRLRATRTEHHAYINRGNPANGYACLELGCGKDAGAPCVNLGATHWLLGSRANEGERRERN